MMSNNYRFTISSLLILAVILICSALVFLGRFTMSEASQYGSLLVALLTAFGLSVKGKPDK